MKGPRPALPPATAEDIKIGKLLYPERNFWRPSTRADCLDVPRPCPYVGCQHNLFLEVTPGGRIKLNGANEPWEVEGPSCALDVAEEGGLALAEVAVLIGGVTRQRAQQLVVRGLTKLEAGLFGETASLVQLRVRVGKQT